MAGLDTEVVVVGAGVVGLACAAELARLGRSVVILERHARIAEECTSRNSGVVHAGLYYASGSLKALTCVEGRRRLVERCARHGIPQRRLGKLVLAVDDSECAALEALSSRARDNDAGAVALLDARQLRAIEPRVRATLGLWSPESGIVDAVALAQSYLQEARAHGALLSLRTELVAIEVCSGGLRVRARSGDELTELTARVVVNAAGLGAQRVAQLAGLDVDALGQRLWPCKGDYFALSPALRGAVEHLVYPMPSHAGLGVHLTLDLAGNLRAGPDTEYVDAPRYDVRPDKAEVFAAALRRYLPEVRAEHLTPDYAGVRPKLNGPNEATRDFTIEGASAHGVPGLINLFGIESPGLTASEAIATRVAALAAD